MLEISADTDFQDNYGEQRDRRPPKTWLDSDVFDRFNKIRRDRGVEWSTIVFYGVAEIEQEIPPFHERYGVTADESADTNSQPGKGLVYRIEGLHFGDQQGCLFVLDGDAV